MKASVGTRAEVATMESDTSEELEILFSILRLEYLLDPTVPLGALPFAWDNQPSLPHLCILLSLPVLFNQRHLLSCYKVRVLLSCCILPCPIYSRSHA